MKKLLLVVVAFGFFFVVNAVMAQSDEAIRQSEPVETGEGYEVFGAEFPDDARFFALGYLIRNSNVFQGKEIATRGAIKQVCQKKGCFFILVNDDYEARITFKDYNFFIPTNSAGKEVRLVGTFNVKERSKEDAKRRNEDADDDPDKGKERLEYQIEATSVKIFE